ncbi:MAG: N-acyl homoserine lactonase AttM [Candidatus Heimdallarchaeota archaeon LC_3]|nr:MAG: N-acyl homoserine lactonase AttM [Candidatus Heimdallarchaeota archaeon LC_3]
MNKTEIINKLIIYNTGILNSSKFLNLNVYSEASLPVFSYLIQHENKWILFDTGLSSLLADNPEKYLGRILDMVVPFRTKKTWVLSSQIQINPEDIDIIILSHRHLDHTGEVSKFKNAKIYIHKDEMKNKNTLLGSLKGVKNIDIPTDTKLTFPAFEYIKNRWGMKQLVDLLGDNSIYLCHTPGHVMGHISVVLNAGIPILLAGDALYAPPSQYQSKKIKKSWDMLSAIYFFKKHGLIFTSHDKIENYPSSKYNWIELKDPTNIALSSRNAFLNENDSVI